MGVFQGTSLEHQSACGECAQPAEVLPHLPVGSRSTVQSSMHIGDCATDPPGTGVPFVLDPSDLQLEKVSPSAEHQRVRDRVPRNRGMLQAKATHLFFSEAMTEGTAGNRANTILNVATRRAVKGSKETPEPPSPRGQSCHCLCNYRGIHTVPTWTADSPRGSVDGTDERWCNNHVVRSTTDDRGRTWQRVRGQRKRFARTRGVLAPAPCITNCSRTRSRARYRATEDDPRRLRFVFRVGAPTLS